MKTATTETQSS